MKITKITTSLLMFFFLHQNGFSQSYYDSQKQNREYKSLQESTKRAYTVPERQTSNYNSYQSSSSSSYSGSASSSSSYNTAIYTNNDNFSWGMTGRARRQEALGAKIEADRARSMAAYEAKVAAVENCYKKIAKVKENYQKIFDCAISSGVDYYTASRIIGFSADDLQNQIDIKNGYSDPRDFSLFEGSTNPNCTGDCKETLTYKDKSGTYYGSTKGNRPHGKGVMTLSNGDTFSGNFSNGSLVGNIIMKTATGDVYEGGYYRDRMAGEGKYTFADGEVNEGTFINNKLNGFGKLVKSTYTMSGIFKDGSIVKKGLQIYEYKNGIKYTINHDYPTQSSIIYSETKNFVGQLNENFNPVKGKFTYDKLSSFDGEFDVKTNPLNGNAIFHYDDGASYIGTFVNGVKRKGTFINDKYTFTGIYDDAGVNFKVGSIQYTDKSINCEAFFGLNNTKNGYRIDYKENGGINETIYNNEQNTGPIRYTNIDNEVLVGTNTHPDYDLYGMIRTKAGAFYPSALKNGSWIVLPESERENAMKIANETIKILQKARAEYELAIK